MNTNASKLWSAHLREVLGMPEAEPLDQGYNSPLWASLPSEEQRHSDDHDEPDINHWHMEPVEEVLDD